MFDQAMLDDPKMVIVMNARGLSTEQKDAVRRMLDDLERNYRNVESAELCASNTKGLLQIRVTYVGGTDAARLLGAMKRIQHHINSDPLPFAI